MAFNAYPRHRTLVVAFEGWNDAGEAASDAARRMRETSSSTQIFELDAEKYVDYQFSRPTVSLSSDGTRNITWPTASIFAPAADDNVYLLLGTEPSRSWRAFTAEVLGVCRSEGIEFVVLLGALLADVPHTRAITVFGTSDNPEVRQICGVERSTYEGPTGIIGVLSNEFEAAGIPTVSLWASVPHYVHHAPSPKATSAILDAVDAILARNTPRGELDEESAAWEANIDSLAADDEGMASYIESLERDRDAVESPEASGEAIAEEFERFLRHRDDPRRG